MSYIRYGQRGSYVDIPNGSSHYIYHNGETINGWSEAEFAALIGSVVNELPPLDGEDPSIRQSDAYIKAAFEEHFGGWDTDYIGWDEQFDGGIPRPERGEIFCQCVDSRIAATELTDELLDAVQRWVEQ